MDELSTVQLYELSTQETAGREVVEIVTEETATAIIETMITETATEIGIAFMTAISNVLIVMSSAIGLEIVLDPLIVESATSAVALGIEHGIALMLDVVADPPIDEDVVEVEALLLIGEGEVEVDLLTGGGGAEALVDDLAGALHPAEDEAPVFLVPLPLVVPREALLQRGEARLQRGEARLLPDQVRKEVEAFLDQKELLELMNATPTESEAYDIVQMEEIERELLGGEFE